jgi:hypothetical protein
MPPQQEDDRLDLPHDQAGRLMALRRDAVRARARAREMREWSEWLRRLMEQNRRRSGSDG